MLPFDGNPIGSSTADTLLTFTDVSGEANTFRLDKVGSQPDRDVQYSLDRGRTWTQYGWTSSTGDSVVVQPYRTVKWRGANTAFNSSSSSHFQFASTGRYNVSGAILSLLDGTGYSTTTPASGNLFTYLFQNNPIVDASKLIMPKVLTETSTFFGFLRGNTYLTTPPELPALTLSSYCYNAIFRGCASLLYVPELPATTLAQYCYRQMCFQCQSLVSAKVLPATTVPNNAYMAMYSYCNNLETGPEIMGTSFGAEALDSMFSNSPKLSSVKVHFDSWTNSNGETFTRNWLHSVASSGTLYCPDTLDASTRGSSRIPTGWEVRSDTT